MVVLSAKKAFIDDHFEEDINIYIQNGKIAYLGKDLPYKFTKRSYYPVLYPVLVNVDLPPISYASLGYHMSCGEAVLFDRGDKAYINIPTGLYGKIGRHSVGIKFDIANVYDRLTPEVADTVERMKNNVDFYVKVWNHRRAVHRDLEKLEFPYEQWLVCDPHKLSVLRLLKLRARGVTFVVDPLSHRFSLLQKIVIMRGKYLFGSQGSVLEAASVWFRDPDKALSMVS